MLKIFETWRSWSLDCALLIAALSLSLVVMMVSTALAGGEDKVSLSHSKLAQAITAAVAVKAGNVAEVEVKTEDGRKRVEVEIVAADDNKPYEICVDPENGTVLLVKKVNITR